MSGRRNGGKVSTARSDRRAGEGATLQAMANTQALIVRWREGEPLARDALIARLHPELAEIAAARLRREGGSSLSSGDLVGEAVMRLIRIERLDLADRAHFLALASRLMRRILVDHARLRNADKRSHQRVELHTNIGGARRIDMESLETALIRLEAVDPQLMEVVEMRYFGGMSIGDVAEVTGLSEATVNRRWRVARAWLASALGERLA